MGAQAQARQNTPYSYLRAPAPTQTMSLALLDVQGTRFDDDAREVVPVLAPRHYQDLATAAYEDAELLLSSILPDARIEHIGASAVPGAYSRGGVDICVAVPRDGFDEALGVLGEAGYVLRAQEEADDRWAALVAPHAALPLRLQLIESGSRHEALIGCRDSLRGDASLLARYNALKIDAGPRGGAAYGAAKARFFGEILGS
jgi:GrpB-like predicted nucleotidyltransferase (UPF0157 family)